MIEHARVGRDILERHSPVPETAVAVEVFRAEIVGHEQVGPAVIVVVGPRAAK